MKYLIAAAVAVALMAPMSSEASFIKEWKEQRGGQYRVEQRQQFHQLIRYKVQKVREFIQSRHGNYKQRMYKQPRYAKYKKYHDKKPRYKVSEPGAIGLMLLGLLGLGLARRQVRAKPAG